MKRTLALVFLVVLLSSIAHAGLQAISEASSPQITATLQSQDPDPVEPGQIITVKFKIENGAQETNEDVTVKLLPKFPFTFYGDTSTRKLGKLKAVSTGADAVIVEYRLKVDEEAVEGDAELELELILGSEGGISYKDGDFMIDIQTHDAILDITSIISEPKQISPGETAEVSIMVKNLADSLLKDIKFKLNFASDDLPLAPYQSSSERRISQLKTNYQNSMDFEIIADPEATPGLYKVPLTITYNDEKGNSYSVSDVLAIIVGEVPKVKAYIKKSTVMQNDKEGKITLEVSNAGSSDIKFLELIILPSDEYELITTSDYFYLGDVDSDDTESEEIDVFVNSRINFFGHPIKTTVFIFKEIIRFILDGDANKLNLPVKLKYYDANNKPFQQQFDLELPIYYSWTLKKFGILEKSKIGTYLFMTLMGIGGYFFYLKKKKPEEYLKKVEYIKALIKTLIRKMPFLRKIPFLKKIPFLGSKKR